MQKRDAGWVIKGFGKDNITAHVLFSDMEVEYAQIYYGGMKGSSLRDLWDELDRIAKKIGTSLEYIKQ